MGKNVGLSTAEAKVHQKNQEQQALKFKVRREIMLKIGKPDGISTIGNILLQETTHHTSSRKPHSFLSRPVSGLT